MMLFASGFLAGCILMKILDAFSVSFKEDDLAQREVYEKGYDDGFLSAKHGYYRD